MTLRCFVLRSLIGGFIFILPTAARSEVKVVISGGFAAAYREILPDFQRTTGINVVTASGSSQGTGPQTIRSMLRRGTEADVVILTRQGLEDLIADGRIVVGTEVDLAETLVGIGVRAGAPKPQLTTVEQFVQTLLKAKCIAIPGSTAGIFLTTELFPKLGIADKIVVKVTPRGTDSTALVATGTADVALQAVSELLNVEGIDFVGTIPAEVQFVELFSAAVVTGSKQQEDSKRLIAFLASDNVHATIKKSGMELKRKTDQK